MSINYHGPLLLSSPEAVTKIAAINQPKSASQAKLWKMNLTLNTVSLTFKIRLYACDGATTL